MSYQQIEKPRRGQPLGPAPTSAANNGWMLTDALRTTNIRAVSGSFV
jgi:hypothetical protein